MLSIRQGTVEEAGGHRPRRRRRTLVVLLGVALLLFAGGFVAYVSSMATTETPPSRNADGIVVLTGAAFRINDALALLAEGRGKRLLISGVNPTTRAQEISRLTPEYRRWFSCCVDLDYTAVNTIGNAVETRRWVEAQGFKSIIVVTSNFHMPRAMAELAHQLPGVTLVPYAVISERVLVDSWWTSQSTTKLLFLEYVKYLAGPIRHWIDI
jgi:uncharacterized SAM-binding protein YcdF (DUF218 family)